jgi:Xaa-Pro aminopeptidase
VGASPGHGTRLGCVPEQHVLRRAALREQLRAADLDALFIVDLLNVRYLTGFTGSNAVLVVSAADEPGAEATTLLCTDGRYLTQSASQVPELERLIDRGSDLALLARMADDTGQGVADYRRTGYESHHVTVDQFDALTGVAPGLDLVRAPGHVEALRLVKDAAEVEALRMACAAADRALADLIEHGGLRPGRTEREVGRELEGRMLDHGAATISFETIVATGANSAIPHHRPTDAELRAGDFVKLDFGAEVDGYHSDMTRTLVLGSPADWQRQIYQLVAESQAAGRAALAPGVNVQDVDAAARTVIEDAGYGEMFLHGLGHGVGLEIHEAPALSRTGDGRLAAGMAVTVEPGVYLAGRGGVRIEDTLVVRETGPELLTLTTKDLVVV